MKLRVLKVAAFKNSSLTALMGAVNDYTAGLAVAAADSGTIDYPDGDVAQKTAVDQQYIFDGTNHSIVLFYA